MASLILLILYLKLVNASTLGFGPVDISQQLQTLISSFYFSGETLIVLANL